MIANYLGEYLLINCKGKMVIYTVEQPEGHHVNQVTKVNVTNNGMNGISWL